MADEEEVEQYPDDAEQNLPEGEEPEDHQDFKPDLGEDEVEDAEPDDPDFAAEVAAGEAESDELGDDEADDEEAGS
jgi:hypothetical protein